MAFLKSAAQSLSPAYLAYTNMPNNNSSSQSPMDYLNQVPGVAQENLGPWAQQGQQAQMQNQGQYNQMVNNPGNFYEQLRSQYTPSSGYKFKEDNMLKLARANAASGGRGNTTANNADQLKLVKDLMAEDEGAYIDRLLGIQNTGLQGNEFAATRGFGAASDLNNTLNTNLTQQAGLAYKNQENENEKKNDWLRMLFTIGGGAIGAFGGPAGVAAGASAGSAIGNSLAGGGSKNSSASNAMQLGEKLPNSWSWGGK